jgi:hypothetical protein
MSSELLAFQFGGVLAPCAGIGGFSILNRPGTAEEKELIKILPEAEDQDESQMESLCTSICGCLLGGPQKCPSRNA